jgi:hypothetical protein
MAARRRKRRVSFTAVELFLYRSVNFITFLMFLYKYVKDQFPK